MVCPSPLSAYLDVAGIRYAVAACTGVIGLRSPGLIAGDAAGDAAVNAGRNW